VITPRHRRRLNRALHELRRPLQALSLLEEGGDRGAPAEPSRRGLLELVGAALAELDRAVNGGPTPATVTRFSAQEMVLACLERWRPAASGAGGFRVLWDAGPAQVEGDPVRMAQAIDNLVANALEHGGPPLVVTGARVAGRVRITVANGSRSNGFGPGGNQPLPVAARPEPNGSTRLDPRRGHGTALVSEVASAHRGRFALCRTGSGCVAALELPLADVRYARAA
jgi:two-component system osmolarity sensor histidine kinase EnvZ